MPLNQGPFLGVPPGEVKSENPDGISLSNDGDPKHNLRDTTGRPAIQSGDWQVRPPGMAPRGRP
jgi:hypothetical protein